MKIAVASGKGGTGKTTVSVNLFRYLNNMEGFDVHLVDCDVEEPNDLIFFPGSMKQESTIVTQLIPEIDMVKCTLCKKCVDYCEFGAVSVIPRVKYATIDAGLCHSCGACLLACSFDALTEKPEPIGSITSYNVLDNQVLTEGVLKVGSSMQTMLIKKLKKSISTASEVILYDAPPGTSCQVVETLSDANFIVLVTEPTPFGLHDMQLIIELINELDKPFGVVINKAGLGNNSVKEYLSANAIELMGEIPFSSSYAAQYADGNLFEDVPCEIESGYSTIVHNLKQKVLVHERDYSFKR
ncbi:P-loop NTPase [Saccharicrinis sp. FJH62]|uniref:nucleotide-binding protein n=1 Tax=Saccharicrinis sp. FJH62 TaxID=3344657 RepID=UPI0035D4D983